MVFWRGAYQIANKVFITFAPYYILVKQFFEYDILKIINVIK